MKSIVALFASLASLAEAAVYGNYFDDACTLPITNVLAFTDVCTWTSNAYSGSFATYLFNCTETDMVVLGYNASLDPTCQGFPGYAFPVTAECTKYEDFYVKGLDFTCESRNTTYNILAHFQADCKDGGLPFSVQLGDPSCQGDSFAPGFLGWDTQGFYQDPEYQMAIYNSTNGTCQEQRTMFQTESFPASCLAPTKPFENLYIDIYQAFPVTPPV